jgi:hypothetical protein
MLVQKRVTKTCTATARKLVSDIITVLCPQNAKLLVLKPPNFPCEHKLKTLPWLAKPDTNGKLPMSELHEWENHRWQGTAVNNLSILALQSP